MARKKPYKFHNAVIDGILCIVTFPLWLIWVVIREIRYNQN